MKKNWRRFFGFVLVLVLMLTCIPVTGLAETATAENTDNNSEVPVIFAGGDGTEENPYRIETAEQLNAIRNNLSAYYVLIKDIDLSGYDSWVPIGNQENAFSGSLEGEKHTISNLCINNNSQCIGLFGYADKNSSIMDVTLDHVDIMVSGINITTSINCGGLAGTANGTVSGINVTGKIILKSNNGICCGGIVGHGSPISSVSMVEMKIETTSITGIYTGGISGMGTPTYCVNYGNIVTKADNYLETGGISGNNHNVVYCVNYGNVSGYVTNCSGYSSGANHCNVGGIGGWSDGHVKNCVNFGNIYAEGRGTSGGYTQIDGTAGGIAGVNGYKYTWSGNNQQDSSISQCYNLGKNIVGKVYITQNGSVTEQSSLSGRICGQNCSNLSDNYSYKKTAVNGIEPGQTGETTSNGENMSIAEIKVAVQPILEAVNAEWTFVDDSSVSGTCGEKLTWILEDGILTISGTGKMFDYGSENPPWIEYTNEINAVVIEDGVTSVGGYAFFGYENISSVTLADSVVDIGEFSFSMCYGLNSIIIPANVISIGMDAFSNCTGLNEIYFEGSAPVFGSDTFVGVTATVYYPMNNITWGKETRQNYGGIVKWIPWDAEEKVKIDFALIPDQVWGFRQNQAGKLNYNHYWKFFPIPGFADLLFAQDDGSSGLCSGMVTSVISISGHDTPPAESFQLSNGNTAEMLHDVTEPDNKSKVNGMKASDYVKYAYVYQSIPLIIMEEKSHKNKLDELYEVIRSSIFDDGEYIEIRIRGIHNGQDTGHVLLAMGIGKNTNEETEIIVYDGNFPDKLQKLHMYKTNNSYTSWSYCVPGFLDWGTGKEYSRISYTTSGDNFAKDMFSSYVEQGLLMNYKVLLSVQNQNVKLSTDDGRKLSLNEETVEKILKIEPYYISVDDEEDVSDNNTFFWLEDDGELKYENGDAENEIKTASENMTINAEIPSGAILIVNVSDADSQYANIQNISQGDSFEIEYFLYDNEKKENISIKGTASDSVETSKSTDGSIIVEGSETLSVEKTSDDGKKYETIDFETNNQSVKISSEFDGEMNIKLDSDGDGNYDKDIPYTNSAPATDLSTCTMTVSQSAYTYTGKAITPTVTITDGANTLKDGTDYTVTYTDNINAGTATVTATGQGSYTDSLNTTFTINKASQKVKASIASSTIKYGGKSPIKASGIGQLTYTSDNTKVVKVDSKGGVTAGVPGKAVITIKAAGDENHKSAKTTLTITVKYAITYKLNGGTNAKSNPAFYDSTTATIKLANPTRTGYTFKGWYADSRYRTKVTSITKGSTGNRTLYAKWSANTYTIKFNGNGAKSGNMASKTSLKYGTSYTLPANMFKAKIGYIFNGWNTKADGSGKSYANKASVKNLTSKNGGVVTLYAQWKKVKYTITYKLNGGTNAKGNPSSYYVTTLTIKLANPTRTGYTFKGWYADSSYRTKVTSITKGSTGNRTLYAKWSANTYTIKFNGNGAKSGSMASKASLKYGISYTLPANTFQAKIGYIFNGWNTKADGSGKSYANKASVKNLTSKNGGVVTLYAQWKKVKYTITYKLSGGTNAKGNPAFYYVTTTTIRLANPTRAGYTFKGWYADSSFKTKVTEIVKGSTGNRTMYAKWTKNPAVHIKNCTVILSKTVHTYDGTAKKPSVTVKDGNSTLVNGKDYTVTYVNNINAGTAAVTVTGKNRYTGSVKKSFSIKMPSKPVMVWNGKTASSFYYGTGTKENPYVIASAEELAYLAKTVNAGKKYTGKYFVLENDIILNKTDNFEAWSEEAPANEWTSIGICTGVGTGMGFNGTLDGQGHVIRGLYINTGNIYAGLFGYVLSEADISNLNLEDSYVSIYSGAKACMAGCLASYSQGMIYNCRLRGYCELRFSCIDELNDNGGAAAGCFVGYNQGTVFGCINGAEGKIVLKDGQYFCYEGGGGGIVGINERTVNSCRFTGTLEIEKINTAEALRADYIGGIVGDNNTAGAVVNCQNSGKMVIREELKSQRQDPLYPGGICGGNTGIVQNCCNLGPMSVIIQVANSSYSLYGNTGGIAACNYGYVENCFSTESASIQGYQSMEKGGIVGNNSSDGIAMNCYWKQSGFTAAGDNSGIITECKTFAQKDGKAVLSGTVLGTTDLTKALNAWITQRAGDSGFSRYRKWASGSNLPVFGSSVAKDNVYTAVKIPSDRCGDHITWSLKNGVLTLSGSGEMYNYSYGTTPWYNQKSSVKKVVIDNRITSIGNWAFLECRYLAQIRIPGSVKSIGTRAFQSCDSLRKIEIPASVDMIYAEAFFDCENILKIVFRNASIEFGDSYMSDGDLGIENKSTCVLYGYKNSTVQEYAGKFGYKFKILE